MAIRPYFFLRFFGTSFLEDSSSELDELLLLLLLLLLLELLSLSLVSESDEESELDDELLLSLLLSELSDDDPPDGFLRSLGFGAALAATLENLKVFITATVVDIPRINLKLTPCFPTC